MMTGQAIRQLQDDATRVASQRNMVPHALFSETTAFEDMRRAPWLGQHVQDDWEAFTVGEFRSILPAFVPALGIKLDRKLGRHPNKPAELFVDKCGFGDVNESALTSEELGQVALSLVAYARGQGITLGVGIYEEGQFQLWMRIYKRRD